VGVVEQSLAKCYLSLEKYAVAKKKLQKYATTTMTTRPSSYQRIALDTDYCACRSIKILQTNNVSAETIMEFRCQLALVRLEPSPSLEPSLPLAVGCFSQLLRDAVLRVGPHLLARVRSG